MFRQTYDIRKKNIKHFFVEQGIAGFSLQCTSLIYSWLTSKPAVASSKDFMSEYSEMHLKTTPTRPRNMSGLG